MSVVPSSVAGACTPLFSDITLLPRRASLRRAITAAWRRPEPELVPELLEAARLPAHAAERSQALALQITRRLRERRLTFGKAGLVQGLLQEFSLSSQEGVALMCLAEALLRIPDTATRDALIRDKIRDGNWKEHLGRAPSLFVNAAAWGLMLTGKLVSTHSEAGMSAALGRLVAKGGEPLIRKGVDQAMRMMGEQFVTGQTIEEALRNAQPMEEKGYRYSYDMLGEAAMTEADAQRYLADYQNAIQAIGQVSQGRGVYQGAGISIKLSALHPRYSRAQVGRVLNELYPRVLGLACLAKRYDIGLNIDAEEADRLELSLDLLERLCFEPELQGWQGLGFVIQAYQKRCPQVVDYLIDLAARSQRRLMIRLVKGAYWDTEIKRAQVDGMDGYPVYTRKAYTDVAYIACARKLLSAPEQIYPQFATHNAQTLAVIHELAGSDSYYDGQYEFQCLHGMGEPLYEQVVGSLAGKRGRPCRIYAPVGTHETLLAYLVRRLLENGANTSFVNRVADPSVPIEELVQDPVLAIEAMARHEGGLGLPHPGIGLPRSLYGSHRLNSRGLDLANDDVLVALAGQLQHEAVQRPEAGPMLAENGGSIPSGANTARLAVLNPADHADVVGHVCHAGPAEVELALQAAVQQAPDWAAVAPAARALALQNAADAMEADMESLVGLLVREAGKTYANAVAEVREAVDFLRFYSAQAAAGFSNDTHRPLGVVCCISPWNFPLAIFTGQIAAALAAGNVVLAKPAEQTSLIAARGVELLWQGGVPRAALQMLPGLGSEIGPLLTGDIRVQGVMFTGSTEVARELQRTLAQRLGAGGKSIPLVAETGGQNAMVVDSSALPEQVVRDVLSSAFDSAGQRCSALRVLCLQEDVADSMLTMLKGAMQELRLGNTMQLHNDVGPVIDADARDAILRHLETMETRGRTVHRLCWGGQDDLQAVLVQGTYVPPTLVEIDSLSELKQEVFGPVLHVLRYRREHLATLLAQIKATGYGLTMGLHTRIDETIRQVAGQAAVGNLYVNRNMVGAVVGVQPFGGEGLSGTGPKAGGPLYLYRLLAARPDAALAQPYGTLVQTAPHAPAAAMAGRAVVELANWCVAQQLLVPVLEPCFSLSAYTLAGPTGERNVYQLHPRAAVLCQAPAVADYIAQLAAVLAVGSRAVWDTHCPVAGELYRHLPASVQACILMSEHWQSEHYELALHQGDSATLLALQQALAEREGAIVTVVAMAPGETAIPLERLVVERAISIDTTAAGGNASLMTMG